jgi:C1A family cysteine protease
MSIGLGRRYAPDPRDKHYLISPPQGAAITRRMWHPSPVLDQGGTSECVGHAARSYLDAGPIVNRRIGPDEHWIYRAAQKVDEWPGEDYDGTSVRAAFKVLKSLELVSAYRWAATVEDVVNHVLTTGPVVMGTLWTMDMFTPDRHGFIVPTGEDVGGHAWLIIGADRNKGFRMVNSWGRGWGDNGRAWVRFGDLERLLHEDGEAAVAVEIKV